MSRESFDTSVLGEFFWNSTDLLSVLGSDGSWEIVNAAWPEQMGWSLEDLQSGPFIDFIHPDDVLATVREFDRLVAAPDATLIEFRNRQRRRDGSYRWIEWSCQGRNGRFFRPDATSRARSKARWNWPGAWRRSARFSMPWWIRSSPSTNTSRSSTSVPALTASTACRSIERRGKNSLNIVSRRRPRSRRRRTAPTLPR